MAVTASQQNIQSNVLAYEELKPYGFCRLEQAVDNTGGTMQLGSVLYRTVDDSASLVVYGAWTEVDAANLADVATTFAGDVELAVIIGTGNVGEALNTSQADIEVSATAKVLLLVRGTAIVRKQYLSYTGTASAGATANLVSALELNMEQVMVAESAEQFDGSYNDVTAITN